MTIERDGMENLPAALDLAVFERTPSGLFRPMGALPGWFKMDGNARRRSIWQSVFRCWSCSFPIARRCLKPGLRQNLESDIWEEDEPRAGRRNCKPLP